MKEKGGPLFKVKSRTDKNDNSPTTSINSYLQNRENQTSESTIEQLNSALNQLAASIDDQFYTAQWNDGIRNYFLNIENFVKNKTPENYEEFKTVCFIYRLMKFESNLLWEEINVLPDVKVHGKILNTLQKVTTLSSKKVDEGQNQKPPKTKKELQHEIRTARYIWQNNFRQKCSRNINPLIIASLMLKALAENQFFIDNQSLEEYSLHIDVAQEHLSHSAHGIEKITNKTGVAKFASGTAGLTTAGIGIAGLVLAPETGGLSLALTVGAMTTGIVGGTTSLTASIVKDKALATTITQTRAITAKAIRYTLNLKELVNDTAKSFEVVNSLLKDLDAKELASKLTSMKSNKEVLSYLQSGASIGWDIFSGITSIGDLNVAVGLLKALNVGVFQPIAKIAGVSATKLPTAMAKATEALNAAFRAGAVGTKILGSIATTVTIFTSINDILDGRKDVMEQDLSKEFIELGEHLHETRNQLLNAIEKFEESQILEEHGRGRQLQKSSSKMSRLSLNKNSSKSSSITLSQDDLANFRLTNLDKKFSRTSSSSQNMKIKGFCQLRDDLYLRKNACKDDLELKHQDSIGLMLSRQRSSSLPDLGEYEWVKWEEEDKIPENTCTFNDEEMSALDLQNDPSEPTIFRTVSKRKDRVAIKRRDTDASSNHGSNVS